MSFQVILMEIRAVAGQRSSHELGFANKLKRFPEQKLKEKSLDCEILVTVT